METKINVAKLLKDCPQGMELDCALFDEPIMFDCILPETSLVYRICAKVKSGGYVFFTENGTLLTADAETKCVIFPKGKTTWEGFHRPFEDGDILVYKNKYNVKYTFIYKRRIDMHYLLQYCGWFSEKPPFSEQFKAEKKMPFYENEDRKFATEEEKQKFFDVIKANGYKWDSEAKILVKFVKPKFKVGDIIQDEDSYQVKITEVNIDDECYGYESILCKGIGGIAFNEHDEWDLVHDKFDVTTLKPFDKVLVRSNNHSLWKPHLFSIYKINSVFPFVCIFDSWSQCVPYEGNEHLLGTTADCSDFYKTW